MFPSGYALSEFDCTFVSVPVSLCCIYHLLVNYIYVHVCGIVLCMGVVFPCPINYYAFWVCRKYTSWFIAYGSCQKCIQCNYDRKYWLCVFDNL